MNNILELNQSAQEKLYNYLHILIDGMTDKKNDINNYKNQVRDIISAINTLSAANVKLNDNEKNKLDDEISQYKINESINELVEVLKEFYYCTNNKYSEDKNGSMIPVSEKFGNLFFDVINLKNRNIISLNPSQKHKVFNLLSNVIDNAIIELLKDIYKNNINVLSKNWGEKIVIKIEDKDDLNIILDPNVQPRKQRLYSSKITLIPEWYVISIWEDLTYCLSGEKTIINLTCNIVKSLINKINEFINKMLENPDICENAKCNCIINVGFEGNSLIYEKINNVENVEFNIYKKIAVGLTF